MSLVQERCFRRRCQAADGDWMGGKGKESLTSRTLTTGKMVMPPPEMEKTWEWIREGENQVLCWSSLFEISGRH